MEGSYLSLVSGFQLHNNFLMAVSISLKVKTTSKSAQQCHNKPQLHLSLLHRCDTFTFSCLPLKAVNLMVLLISLAYGIHHCVEKCAVGERYCLTTNHARITEI